jgi:5-methylcytosine-specific restriction protein B
LRPKNENENVVYEVEDGIFKKMCILAIWEVLKNKNNENENLNYIQIKQKVINAIKNKKLTKDDFQNAPKYYLIIDEINRGNISNILGELITLLEKDKRLGEDNEIIIDLPYSKEPFAVPPNLYIIGTMNTADKSIALLDTALRRRFGFLEIEPNYDLITKDNLINVWKEKCNDKEFNKIKKEDIEKMFQKLGNDEFLKKLLETINTKITLLKDRDHRIGHSYFLNVKDIDDLRFVWYNEIIPLLMEYFYNDWESFH